MGNYISVAAQYTKNALLVVFLGPVRPLLSGVFVVANQGRVRRSLVPRIRQVREL